jgi:hypothetical protein
MLMRKIFNEISCCVTCERIESYPKRQRWHLSTHHRDERCRLYGSIEDHIVSVRIIMFVFTAHERFWIPNLIISHRNNPMRWFSLLCILMLWKKKKRERKIDIPSRHICNVMSNCSARPLSFTSLYCLFVTIVTWPHVGQRFEDLHVCEIHLIKHNRVPVDWYVGIFIFCFDVTGTSSIIVCVVWQHDKWVFILKRICMQK